MGGLVEVRESDHHGRFHHRTQSWRSRCRESSSANPPATYTSTTDRSEGRRRETPYCSSSPAEGNSFNKDSRSSEVPIRALLARELSRETEIKHQPTSVIARLMGLDTLPQRISHKQQKDIPIVRASEMRRSVHSQKEEFKDVYEVTESSKVEKYKNQHVLRSMPSPNKNQKELSLGRRNFMDSKRFPIDDGPQNCEELNEYLEGPDSNDDRLPEFLREPYSLPSKHHHDLKCCPPSSQPSVITILRSSKFGLGKYEESREVLRKPERKAESYSHLPKDTISYRRPMSTLDRHSMKEHDPYASKGTGKTDTAPTRIVVLKPSFDQAQEMAKNVPLPRSTESYQFDFRRHREFPLSGGIQELQDEGRERHKVVVDSQVVRHKTKGSREIAREVTEQLRFRHLRDESSSKKSQRTSDNFDHRNRNYHPSTSYPSESSVSKEARKRLSERWNMTHRFQEAEPSSSGSGSGTLGEMLALSGTETPRTSYSSVSQKASAERNSRHEVRATQGYPSGISSGGASKDRFSADLTRSTSLPEPTVHRTPKPRSRYSDSGSDYSDNSDLSREKLNFEPNDSLHGYSVRRHSSRRYKYGSDKIQPSRSSGEESIVPVREIHVIRPANLAEENKLELSATSDRMNANTEYLVENSSSSESLNVKLAGTATEVQAQQQQPMYGEYGASDQIDMSTEEILDVQLQEDMLCASCDGVESGLPITSKGSEQPSPVSVLEPAVEEETYSSQCFEKISADLQSIRMQLQLLKVESDDNSGDDSQKFVSDDEMGREHDSVLPSGGIQKPFTNDEDRDFAYLLDVMVSSGINGANKDRLFSTCYLPEYPVDPAVFEKIENNYGVSVAWPKSERKLLFDHINSVLAEMLAPCMDLHPWANSKRKLGPVFPPRGLAEDVWRIVVRQRKQLCIGNPEDKVLETEWMELGDYVDMIGREIEKTLKEELLEELVSELILEKV